MVKAKCGKTVKVTRKANLFDVINKNIVDDDECKSNKIFQIYDSLNNKYYECGNLLVSIENYIKSKENYHESVDAYKKWAVEFYLEVLSYIQNNIIFDKIYEDENYEDEIDIEELFTNQDEEDDEY